jgi:O-antigen/teichoic acid export membrane protein
MFQRLIALAERPGVRRYIENISWMLFTRVFTLGVSFLTTLYIARTLGPANFGELDYALAIVGMFGIIASWGIDGVLNRELIKTPDHKGVLIGTACALRFFLSIFACICVLLFAFFSSVDQLSKLLLTVLSLTYFFNTVTILQQVFYAQAESKYPSLITAAVTVITNLTKVVILLSGKGIIYLAASMILESVLYALLYYVAYKRVLNGKIASWSFSLEKAGVFLKTGTAVAFLGVFAMVYSRIDQIMIKHMLDATSVGLYSAGVRIVEVWGFIPTIIGAGLYPAILHARKVSEKFYGRRLRRTFFLYALPSFGIALGVSLGARLLMSIIYGDEFMGGFRALQIYAWSLPGTFMGLYVMNILFTDDYRKVLVFTAAFPALVNVALNLAWIPTSGIIGAAWATVVSYSLIPFMPLLFTKTRTALQAIYRP